MWRAERTKTHFGEHATEWSIFDGEKRIARIQGSKASAEQTAKLIVRLADENAQLRRDIGTLLANIDWMMEVTGEGPEGEDAAMIDAIRKSPGITAETVN